MKPLTEEEFRNLLENKYSDVPANTRETIVSYVYHNTKPGGFVTACLMNDLYLAVSTADSENLAALKDIVWIVNYDMRDAMVRRIRNENHPS